MSTATTTTRRRLLRRRRTAIEAALAVALASAAGCRSAPLSGGVRAAIEARAALETGRAAIVRDLPFFPSDEPDDCGAAALSAALSRAGVHCDPRRVREAIFDAARGGAPTSALVRYARAEGVFALCRERWWLDDLKMWIRAGVAPIVLLSAGPLAPGRFHYVLLEAYDDDARLLLVQDQSSAEVALPYDDFFPLWCEARGWALVVCSPSIRLPAGECGLSARELGALGWLAERRKDFEAAQRHYRAALARDPAFREAAHNLQNVESALGKKGGS